jgi:hypothetical protein
MRLAFDEVLGLYDSLVELPLAKFLWITLMSPCDDYRNAPDVPDVVQRIGREHHEVRHGASPQDAYRVGAQELCR